MNLFTSTVWQSETIGENDYEFAETSDPRVLAVIQRDQFGTIAELYDGDAINPIIYIEGRYGLNFSYQAGYDDGSAELIQQAYERWGWGDETARRYLWIFHGIAAVDVSGGYDRSGSWIVITSNAYLDHIGVTERPATYAEAQEDCAAIAQDLEWALDGYVYGIGWATREERRLHDDEEIELNEWDIEIQCWGFVGEDYSKRSAAAFEAGGPSLPEMIEVPA